MKAALMIFLMTYLFAASTDVVVYQNPDCGCCDGWIKYMRASGFHIQQHKDVKLMMEMKNKFNLSDEQRSCHTAIINGYIIEGHVPPDEIKRLLKEMPDARGIIVPGMPLGSYGMDYDSREEHYDVLLLNKDGSTKVFARYKGKNMLDSH